MLVLVVARLPLSYRRLETNAAFFPGFFILVRKFRCSVLYHRPGAKEGVGWSLDRAEFCNNGELTQIKTSGYGQQTHSIEGTAIGLRIRHIDRDGCCRVLMICRITMAIITV
jgi:hypothetical protein